MPSHKGSRSTTPELLARIGALLRRAKLAQRTEVLQAAGINLDLTTREVVVDGVPVSLSAKEFLLLAALARDPRRVYRKQELLESVWGFRSTGATRTSPRTTRTAMARSRAPSRATSTASRRTTCCSTTSRRCRRADAG
jgi:DNA-binding response OmpR family regulator